MEITHSDLESSDGLSPRPGGATAPPATLAGGKYVIERSLGSGAMGEVYEARHDALQRKVAIKLLHPAVTKRPHAVERFRREALAASRIEHRHSTRVLDFGEEHGTCYIVMELLDGVSLGDLVEREGTLSLARAVRLMSQVLSALAVAHDAGIVHRDLKPDNVVVVRAVDDQGELEERAKVCDFGIAKLYGPTSSETLTQDGTVSGTPHYMSPEQCQGHDLDARSDLYACGVMLFRLVVGELPFTGDNPFAIVYRHVTDPPPVPSSLRPELPKAVDDFIATALAKTPGDRFQSARAMRQALQKLQHSTNGGPRVVVDADGQAAHKVVDRRAWVSTSSASRNRDHESREDLVKAPTLAAAPTTQTVLVAARSPRGWVALGLLLCVAGGAAWWQSARSAPAAGATQATDTGAAGRRGGVGQAAGGAAGVGRIATRAAGADPATEVAEAAVAPRVAAAGAPAATDEHSRAGAAAEVGGSDDARGQTGDSGGSAAAAEAGMPPGAGPGEAGVPPGAGPGDAATLGSGPGDAATLGSGPGDAATRAEVAKAPSPQPDRHRRARAARAAAHPAPTPGRRARAARPTARPEGTAQAGATGDAARAAAPARAGDTSPTKPANGPAKPTSETMKPASETAKPASETTKPASETTKPASETAKPASEAAKPANAAAKPAGAAPPAAKPPTPAVVAPPPFNPAARIAVQGVQIDGGLTKRAVSRALAPLVRESRDCWLGAGRAAKLVRRTTVTLRFTVDEDGRFRRVVGQGGSTDLARCVARHAGRLRSRSRPDTGTVDVKASVVFTP